MNRITRNPLLLSAAVLMTLGLSTPSFAVDANAPARAVQGTNPAAPSTQSAPSGNSNSNTNGANSNNYNTNTNSSGSVGNGSINNNANGTGSGATGTSNSAEPSGTLEEQRRESGAAMERERKGEE